MPGDYWHYITFSFNRWIAYQTCKSYWSVRLFFSTKTYAYVFVFFNKQQRIWGLWVRVPSWSFFLLSTRRKLTGRYQWSSHKSLENIGAKLSPWDYFPWKLYLCNFFLVKVKLIQKMYSTIQVSRPVFGTPLACTFLRTALVLQYFLCIVPSMEFVVLSIDWGAHALVLFLGTVFCIGLMSWCCMWQGTFFCCTRLIRQ